jgi:hypothetical protein
MRADRLGVDGRLDDDIGVLPKLISRPMFVST